MKQQLWILNSSLSVMLVASLFVNDLLRQEPPLWRPTRASTSFVEKKDAAQAQSQSWDKVFQDDIFDTYVVQEVKSVKQNYITPIPEPRAPTIAPPPEPKKQEFVAPLPITLKGIIIASDEARNVAMIADESNKEALYHLGDMVKDAQIIKIAKNRVVFLRANGQQEVFYLRKDDNAADPASPDKWKEIVRKVNDQTFEIDPQEFVKEIESLGLFIERLGVVGTAYQQGAPIGIRIGKSAQNDVGSAIGINEGDIVTVVNDLNVADAKNRLVLYDAITNMQINGLIKVTLKRGDVDVQITYKLVKIEKPKKYSTIPGIRIVDKAAPEEPMNKMQQREKTLREFQKNYDGGRQQQTIMDIRRRLLENLQNRMQNVRNR